MTTGNIPLAAQCAYTNYNRWHDKFQISTSDESETQFEIDLQEAIYKFRRDAFHLVRERIICMNSDYVAYLPVKFLTDGDMDGKVDKNDIQVYEQASDGMSFDAVSSDDIDSVDLFNNSITFSSDYSPTRQIYITYFACSKPFDEVITDDFRRAVECKVTLIALDRLRRKRLAKGISGYSVGGNTVNRDEQAFMQMYRDLEKEYKSYVTFLRPFVGRAARTGQGTDAIAYDPSMAYSSQMIGAYSRLGRNRL